MIRPPAASQCTGSPDSYPLQLHIRLFYFFFRGWDETALWSSPMRKNRSKRSKVSMRKGFVKRLQTVRGKRSQAQFARDLDVFQQNINRYEHGTLPHVDFLITLSTVENVSVDWLLLGRGSRNLR